MTLLLLLRPHGSTTYANPTPFSWTSGGSTPALLTQPLVFTSWLCKSTGEPVELLDRLKSRQIVQQLNLPASFEITMNVDDDVYAYAVLENHPRLKVYRPASAAELAIDPVTKNKLVFYGSLPSEGVDEDSETGEAKLVFQEPSWVFNQRNVVADVSFAQIDQGAILWSLINLQNLRTNGDTFIKQGVVTTGILRDRTYEAGKNLADLISEMTKVDGGCDVGLTPFDYWEFDKSNGMAKFNAYSQIGTVKPTVKFVSGRPVIPGTTERLGSNCQFRRSRAKAITSATSVGSAATQTYANTTSGFGLLEDYETFTDVSIAQTLLDKSVGKVANGQNAPMILEARPTDLAPVPLLDYVVGDTVYSSCKRGSMEFYDLATRVHGIDITIDQNGKLTTKPTLATLPETIVPPVLGGLGGGTGTLGSERISFAASNEERSLINPTTEVSHGSDTIIGVTGTSILAVSYPGGTMNGLVAGQPYTLSCLVRGNDLAPVSGGSIFQVYANTGPYSGGQLSANDATHIWNATLATRQTWTTLSVTFTAISSSMWCGIRIATIDINVNAYTCRWGVVPA